MSVQRLREVRRRELVGKKGNEEGVLSEGRVEGHWQSPSLCSASPQASELQRSFATSRHFATTMHDFKLKSENLLPLSEAVFWVAYVLRVEWQKAALGYL